MNRLDELKKELCPKGVEYKRIDELCNISRGRVMSKDYIKNNIGEYPVYSSQTENNGELGKIGTYDFEGEYLTWTTDGANAGSVFYRNGKFSVTNVCGLLKVTSNTINTKYLYYALSVEAPKYVNAGMGNPKLMSNVMARIKIAVPPLDIQYEIIRILEELTEFSVELSKKLFSELEVRQKQYEYYRDKLVGKEVKNISLCEILKIKNGKDYKSNGSGDIPVYGSGGIIAYNSKYAFDKPSVLIPRKGSINKLYYVDEPFWNVDTIFYTDINMDLVVPKYLYYCLENEHLEELNTAGGVPSLTQTVLNKVRIYMPSIAEQNKIVKKLDELCFFKSSLCENITIEIEKNKKQYEYYRDKLLSFKEVEVNE